MRYFSVGTEQERSKLNLWLSLNWLCHRPGILSSSYKAFHPNNNSVFEIIHQKYGLHPVQNGGERRTHQTGPALYYRGTG